MPCVAGRKFAIVTGDDWSPVGHRPMPIMKISEVAAIKEKGWLEREGIRSSSKTALGRSPFAKLIYIYGIMSLIIHILEGKDGVSGDRGGNSGENA